MATLPQDEIDRLVDGLYDAAAELATYQGAFERASQQDQQQQCDRCRVVMDAATALGISYRRSIMHAFRFV